MKEGKVIARPLIDDTALNREELRVRLREMTNRELGRFGRAVRNMYSLETNRGNTPRAEVVIQLEEAWAEWISRFTPHPMPLKGTSAGPGPERTPSEKRI
jgi:hypothetical protein